MNTKTNTTSRLAALFIFSGFIASPATMAQISDFERPFGFGFGEETQPFDPSSRDVNGNRLIVDGRIITGDDLSSFTTSTLATGGQSLSGAGFGGQFSGNTTAIGNQLNVITQGSFNTVIVDSTQINNGDQTAITNAEPSDILNGEINLND